jgi:diguanylate cyclase (GGDEF)-like protein
MKPVSITSLDVRSLPGERSGSEEALERLLQTRGVGVRTLTVERAVVTVPREPELLAPVPCPRTTLPEGECMQVFDPLTKLASRASFLARLRRSTAPEWCVEGLFVLLLDVDDFRGINERFGYEAADELLVAIGVRLRRRLRPSDTLARFGADSFAVLLGGIRSGEDVTRVAERLQGELAEPFALDGKEMRVHASVGVAMGSAGVRAEAIVRDAERALARAQLLGRASGPPLAREADAREGPLQRIETALRRALDQEEFRARYRPTVLRKEGSVPGFEIVLFKRRDTGARPPSRGAA